MVDFSKRNEVVKYLNNGMKVSSEEACKRLKEVIGAHRGLEALLGGSVGKSEIFCGDNDAKVPGFLEILKKLGLRLKINFNNGKKKRRPTSSKTDKS